MPIGLIGGSGLYDIEGTGAQEDILVSTPYGAPSSVYRRVSLNGTELIFLARHGVPHSIPPHKVNYRANMWGFKSLGVEEIIAVGAVGGISSGVLPGSLVIPDQIIDFTMGARIATYYEKEKVVHVDFTDPYCLALREILINAAAAAGLAVRKTGTYACTNGPRLETAKEIDFLSRIGADVVGMTAMPEAVLARELEICYAGILVVTNYAAGMGGGALTATEVVDTMKKSTADIRSLIGSAVAMMPRHRSCACKNALKDAAL